MKDRERKARNNKGQRRKEKKTKLKGELPPECHSSCSVHAMSLSEAVLFTAPFLQQQQQQEQQHCGGERGFAVVRAQCAALYVEVIVRPSAAFSAANLPQALAIEHRHGQNKIRKEIGMHHLSPIAFHGVLRSLAQIRCHYQIQTYLSPNCHFSSGFGTVTGIVIGNPNVT